MTLTPQLADRIASKAQSILKRQVLMADTTGRILSEANTGIVVETNPEALTSVQAGIQIVSQLETGQVMWSPFVYENQTLGAFGLALSSGPITPEAMALIQGLAEVITHQYYLDNRIQSRDQLRQSLLNEILTSPKIDAEDLARRSDILQLNIGQPAGVIMVKLSNTEAGLDQTIHKLWPNEGLANQAIMISHHEAAIIMSPDHPRPGSQNTNRWLATEANKLQLELQKAQQETVTVGCGQYHPGLDGLRQSYREAKLALEVGKRVWGPGRVYSIRQVGMYVTLTSVDSEFKADLASQIFSPLLQDEQLYKTVQAFLAADLNLTEASERLHIHRNTLIYRLDKIRKLIGLDPRNFDDALQIKLGLMFYQPAEV